MAITKAKKQDIVAKVAASLKDAVSVVSFASNKITVADTSAMRKSLKNDGVGYYVREEDLDEARFERGGLHGNHAGIAGRSCACVGNHGMQLPPRAACMSSERNLKAFPSWEASLKEPTWTQPA